MLTSGVPHMLPLSDSKIITWQCPHHHVFFSFSHASISSWELIKVSIYYALPAPWHTWWVGTIWLCTFHKIGIWPPGSNPTQFPLFLSRKYDNLIFQVVTQYHTCSAKLCDNQWLLLHSMCTEVLIRHTIFRIHVVFTCIFSVWK